MKQEITSLEQQLQMVKVRASKLEKIKAETAETEEQFEEIAILLPKEKEIPQLLKDISALGRNAGLDFNTFRPESERPMDFYKEIPISIKVRGPYHNMGYFFDQVSKIKRIVSVDNVKMSSPKKEDGEMLLQSDCTLLTYQFSNQPLSKDKKKK